MSGQEFEIMRIMRISCQDFKIAQEKYIKKAILMIFMNLFKEN